MAECNNDSIQYVPRHGKKEDMLEEMRQKNNKNQADRDWPNDANVKPEALQSEAHAFQLYVA